MANKSLGKKIGMFMIALSMALSPSVIFCEEPSGQKVGKGSPYYEKSGSGILTKTEDKNLFSKNYIGGTPKYFEGNFLQTPGVRTTEGVAAQKSFMYPLVNTEKNFQGASKETTQTNSTYPAEFSWLNNNGNWMTPVKDQGKDGLCQLFAIMGAIEAKEKIVSNNVNYNPDLSEQVILCERVQIVYPEVILNYIKTNGVGEESVSPYAGIGPIVPTPSCQIPTNVKKHFITTWKDVSSSWPSEPTEIRNIVKQAIIEKGPLVTGINMSGRFDAHGIFRCTGISSDFERNHAILLVGYKDTGDIHTSYYIAKNSWGSKWNKDGYFKIGWDRYVPGVGFRDQCRITDFSPYFVEVPELKVDVQNVRPVL